MERPQPNHEQARSQLSSKREVLGGEERLTLSLDKQQATTELLAMLKDRRLLGEADRKALDDADSRQTKRDEIRATKRAARGESNPDESTVDGLRTGKAMQNERTKQMYERLDNLGGAYEIDPRDREDGQSVEAKARIEMLKANIKDNAQDRSQEIENSADKNNDSEEFGEDISDDETVIIPRSEMPSLETVSPEPEAKFYTKLNLETAIKHFKKLVDSYDQITSDDNSPRDAVIDLLDSLDIDSDSLQAVDADNPQAFTRELGTLDSKIKSELGRRRRKINRDLLRAKNEVSTRGAEAGARPTLENIEYVFNAIDSGKDSPLISLDLNTAYDSIRESMGYGDLTKTEDRPNWLANLGRARRQNLNFQFMKEKDGIMYFADQHLFVDGNEVSDDVMMDVAIGIPTEFMPDAISASELQALSPYELQRQAA